jgi:hypothetical protein
MTRESRTEARGAGAVIVALVLMLLVPVAYVLSVGPVLKSYNGDLPDAWLVFYAPLVWLDAHAPLCRQFFEWYVRLWGVR